MEENKIKNELETNSLSANSNIHNFYTNYFHLVKNYITNNSGTLEDAKDIFQEVAFAYFKHQSKSQSLIIDNEKNYVLGIARNTWLKKIKQNKKTNTIDIEYLENVSDAPVDETKMRQNDLIEVVLGKLQEISEECRKIIHSAFYLKLSAIEIANLTGYSENFIKVKKYRCLQGLKKIVTGSIDFRNFKM